MKKFTNPLDRVKIASPCGANWNEMRGSDRQRYCALCRLNVYNLSGMTRAEAESFLINAEGRVCVQVHRRADGSVITRDCPVGWARIKRKAARAATAVFSLIGGFFGGVFALQTLQTLYEFTNYDKVREPFLQTPHAPADNKKNGGKTASDRGRMSNLAEVKADILKKQDF